MNFDASWYAKCGDLGEDKLTHIWNVPETFFGFAVVGVGWTLGLGTDLRFASSSSYSISDAVVRASLQILDCQFLSLLARFLFSAQRMLFWTMTDLRARGGPSGSQTWRRGRCSHEWIDEWPMCSKSCLLDVRLFCLERASESEDQCGSMVSVESSASKKELSSIMMRCH